MIISHAHRFVFIKTRKTAGTSIEIELSKHCGPEDIITPIVPDDEVLRAACGGRVAQNFASDRVLDQQYQKAALAGNCGEMVRILRQIWPNCYYNHIPITEVMDRCGPLVDYFWFTAERDPYDRIISYIYWRKKPEKPFSFVRRAYYVMKFAPSPQFQNFHLYSAEGNVAVDAIIKYDDLNRDFGMACDKIGIPAPKKLIETKNSQRKCRSKSLSILERAIVQFYCAKEFAALKSRAQGIFVHGIRF